MGVSTDPVSANAAFAERYGFPFPLLSDTTGEVCHAYGACESTEPRDGPRRNTYVISPGGVIVKIYQDAGPADHAELVLDFLRQEGATHMDPHTQSEAAIVSDEPRTETPPDSKHHHHDHRFQAAPSGGGAAVSEAVPAQLVFAVGTLGYDLVSEARRDSIMQHMDGLPDDPEQLLSYLQKSPHQAAAVTWTLSLDSTPIYAIEPGGPFAVHVYERLRTFYREQLTEAVERVSVPGIVTGRATLMSGLTVPVISPQPRCMYNWATSALVRLIAGEAPKGSDKKAQRSHEEKARAVTNFLERVYHELRNLGVTAPERALNYAATNALNVEHVFEMALREEMELDSIAVDPSPVCRPGAECWDVKLGFFDPRKLLEQARRVHRFTVDVSDECPVMVGPVRSWWTR